MDDVNAMAEKRAERPGLGFLHITRTGGEYLSAKIGLARHDPLLSRHHDIPSQDILRQRKNWFTMVRNPYERICSEIFYAKIIPAFRINWEWPRAIESLPDFILPDSGHFALQAPYVKVADRVIHYENMMAEANSLMVEWGYPEINFEDFRAGPRKTHLPRKTLANLTQVEKDIIYEKYRADFDALGYDK